MEVADERWEDLVRPEMGELVVCLRESCHHPPIYNAIAHLNALGNHLYEDIVRIHAFLLKVFSDAHINRLALLHLLFYEVFR